MTFIYKKRRASLPVRPSVPLYELLDRWKLIEKMETLCKIEAQPIIYYITSPSNTPRGFLATEKIDLLIDK